MMDFRAGLPPGVPHPGMQHPLMGVPHPAMPFMYPPGLSVVSKPPPRSSLSVSPATTKTSSIAPPTPNFSNASAPPQSSSASKSSFAAALRDLAKNANGPSDRDGPSSPKRSAPGPTSIVTIAPTSASSSLMDIRKGFDRSLDPKELKSSLGQVSGLHQDPIYSMALATTMGLAMTTTSMAPSRTHDLLTGGFQPYRPAEALRPPPFSHPGAPVAYGGYHPALFGSPSMQGLQTPYGLENDPLYRAQLERYAMAAELAAGRASMHGMGPMHPYAGIPPSLLPAYPAEMLRSAGLVPPSPQPPPPPPSALLMQEKLREEESRRHEKEVRDRREAERREHNRSRNEHSSPASRPSSTHSSAHASSQRPTSVPYQEPPSRLQAPQSQASGNGPAPPRPIPSWEGQASIASSANMVSHLDKNHPLSRQMTGVQTSLKPTSLKPSDIVLPTKPLDIADIKDQVTRSLTGPPIEALACTSNMTRSIPGLAGPPTSALNRVATPPTINVVSMSSSPPTSAISSSSSLTTNSVSASTSSPSINVSASTPLTTNALTASRCSLYTPKIKTSPLTSPPSSIKSSSSPSPGCKPRKLFVRPFEDDYAPPVRPASSLSSGEDQAIFSPFGVSCDENKNLTQTPIKLELEEKLIKQEDQDSDYESMSSDSSTKKEGVLCPTSGRIIPEEESPVPKEDVFREPGPDCPTREKLKFLRYFRLVTHSKKNDSEIAKLEKRKERLRERSPSPIPEKLRKPASPSLPLPSLPPHRNHLPDPPAKLMYLSAIGLCRNSEDQKYDYESIWSTILDDRLSRNANSTINTYFSRVRDMGALPARGAKRSWRGTLLSPGATDDETPPPYYNTSLNIPTSASLSCLTRHRNDSSGSSLSISTTASGPSGPILQDPQFLPSSLPINLSTLVPISKSSLLLQEVKSEPTPALPAHLQLASLPRMLGTNSRIKMEPEDLSINKKKKTGLALQWPGIEAVIESYNKYQTERDQERIMSGDRLSRLQGELISRRGQMDNLSTRLASLARLQSTLASNHMQAQRGLDSLRSTLLAIASTPMSGGK